MLKADSSVRSSRNWVKMAKYWQRWSPKNLWYLITDTINMHLIKMHLIQCQLKSHRLDVYILTWISGLKPKRLCAFIFKGPVTDFRSCPYWVCWTWCFPNRPSQTNLSREWLTRLLFIERKISHRRWKISPSLCVDIFKHLYSAVCSYDSSCWGNRSVTTRL